LGVWLLGVLEVWEFGIREFGIWEFIKKGQKLRKTKYALIMPLSLGIIRT